MRKYFLIAILLEGRTMKLILTFTLLLALTSFTSCEKVEEYQWIYPQSGLKLRSKPGLRSKVLTVIPYGERVQVLEYGTNKETIDKVVGRWARVQWMRPGQEKKMEGWVFSHYLSKTRPRLIEYTGTTSRNIGKFKSGCLGPCGACDVAAFFPNGVFHISDGCHWGYLRGKWSIVEGEIKVIADHHQSCYEDCPEGVDLAEWEKKNLRRNLEFYFMVDKRGRFTMPNGPTHFLQKARGLGKMEKFQKYKPSW